MTRLPLLPTLIVCSFPVISHAAEAPITPGTYQAWAPGVSISGGWVDFDKTPGDADYIADDEGMCWAATASNVITWWQTQNAKKLMETTLPSTSVWDVFRTVYSDVGITPNYGYNWWINGTDYNKDYMDFNVNAENKETSGWYPGGFLKSVYDTSEFSINIAAEQSETYDAYEFSKKTVAALNDGYALSISAYDSAAHAYTLWGVEYEITNDAQYKLTKAWVTDSDDGATKLVEKALVSIDYKASAISFNDGEGGVNLTWQYLDGMRTIVVPEPSAFGLIAGTLALALVASSRRRNRLR